MGELTTYRVGGRRRSVRRAGAASTELSRLAEVVATTGIEVVVLGKGSNVLVADAGLSTGCAYVSATSFAVIEIEADGCAAGGAASYPVLARRTAPRRDSPASSGPSASPARSEAP